MDWNWNTFVLCWLAMTGFVTSCSMRWTHWRDWRFYAYLPFETIINLFWPFHVAAMFVHYKKTVKTRMYD